MLYKLAWFFRGMIFKIFFGEFRFPSYLGKPVFICRLKRIHISKYVRIFPGARLEPVDDDSLIIFEENVSVGQNLHLTSKGKLVIGRNTTILENVMITNIDHDYTEIGVHILKQKYIINKTIIGENCFIGYGAVIQAGTILGTQCIVGANSVVRGKFPDYCVIVGAPAKIIKRYDPIDSVWKKTDSIGNFI